MSLRIDSDRILKIWTADRMVSDQTLMEKLESISGIEGNIWNGWVNDFEKHPLLSEDLLKDEDNDGVLNLIEHHYGTDALAVDSDHDGWSDYAEIILKQDPIKIDNHPRGIVPDGVFKDWEILIPGLIRIDNDSGGSCSMDADIEGFSAISERDKLSIGVKMKARYVSGTPKSVYAYLDIDQTKKKFVIRATQGQRFYDAIDPASGNIIARRFSPIPNGGEDFELVFDSKMMTISDEERKLIDFTKAGSVRLRLLSEEGGESKKFCDDTIWFKPYIAPPYH